MAIIQELSKEQNFRINLIKGQIAKEMVRALLERSRYSIYAFGYESLLSQLRYDVKNRNRVPQNDSNNRLRSTPDLLGYDREKRRTYFIEVKFRSAHSPKKVRLSVRDLIWYQKYWSDSIIIIVIPTEQIFYAQYIQNLKLDGLTQYRTHDFDLEKEFRPIQDLFTRVETSEIQSFIPVLKKFEMMPNGVDYVDLDAIG